MGSMLATYQPRCCSRAYLCKLWARLEADQYCRSPITIQGASSSSFSRSNMKRSSSCSLVRGGWRQGASVIVGHPYARRVLLTSSILHRVASVQRYPNGGVRRTATYRRMTLIRMWGGATKSAERAVL